MKQEKVKHEAPLIESFKEIVSSDSRFGIQKAINIGDDNATCSDVEYLSKSGEYLIIEAKSHESKDAYNTRHKIFGQLLKEHGKASSFRKEHNEIIALGVLIPKDKTSSGKSNTKKSGYDFYRDGYVSIPEELFAGFGELVKAKYIFVCSIIERTIDVYSWNGFHQGDSAIYSIGENA
ncbi:hypothetical protein ACJJIR_01340 [Microbulbifer sp. SSSA008]|uniref:hypothetical protein n=1 Tax=Microbulbifer sp. SSSA008 TaxID=3243380 RepID=UPI0040395847